MAPLNLGGLGDLAGVTEIETLDLGAGSRRGSFSKPRDTSYGRNGSESKERGRADQVNTSAIGIPRPNTGPSFDGMKRPQTQEQPMQGLISGGYNLGGNDRILVAGGGATSGNYGKSNNPYSEVASSYKGDDDDALSHYMGQSEYGGLSNLGGIGGGGGGLNNLGSAIPTIDTGKSRRMAGRPSTGAAKINAIDDPPTLSKNMSNKNADSFFGIQDEVTSNYNRLGSGGAERGSNSKPSNSRIFG
jgi:hypothetical protein